MTPPSSRHNNGWHDDDGMMTQDDNDTPTMQDSNTVMTHNDDLMMTTWQCGDSFFICIGTPVMYLLLYEIKLHCKNHSKNWLKLVLGPQLNQRGPVIWSVGLDWLWFTVAPVGGQKMD